LDALGPFANTVAHARATNHYRTVAGHDLALGQMAVARVTSPAYLSSKLATSASSFNRLREKCSRPVAQDLGQRISERPWLGELQNVSVGHGVSSLDGESRP
jgi:hypothetical protein